MEITSTLLSHYCDPHQCRPTRAYSLFCRQSHITATVTVGAKFAKLKRLIFRKSKLVRNNC